MQLVADILRSKPDQSVYSIESTMTVFEAVSRMAERNIGALMVMEGEHVVGIVTERDYAQKVVLEARTSRETPVRDIMTAAVIYVRPDQTSADCLRLMGAHRLRHLPVLDGGKLIGMISIRDLANDIIANL
jgi:CBS domain-containing protein